MIESKEDVPEEKEQLVTEVTSVAQEELKTGVKIEIPTSEELVARASVAFIRNKKMFNAYFSELSTKAKIRVMNSVLDLPADGVPVYLRDDKEKAAFALGQRTISDMFIITQHYIVQQFKKQKAADAEAKATEKNEEAEEKTLDNGADKS